MAIVVLVHLLRVRGGPGVEEDRSTRPLQEGLEPARRHLLGRLVRDRLRLADQLPFLPELGKDEGDDRLLPQLRETRHGAVVHRQSLGVALEGLGEDPRDPGLDSVDSVAVLLANLDNGLGGLVPQPPVVFGFGAKAELLVDEAGYDDGDDLVEVLLQGDGRVVKEGLDHLHEVLQDVQLALGCVDFDAFDDVVAELREELVEAGVRAQAAQGLLALRVGEPDTRLRNLAVVELLLHRQPVGLKWFDFGPLSYAACSGFVLLLRLPVELEFPALRERVVLRGQRESKGLLLLFFERQRRRVFGNGGLNAFYCKPVGSQTNVVREVR